MLRKSIILGSAVAACIVGLGGALAQDSQPNVSLGRDLVAAASAFETFTRTTSAIDAGFANPRAVMGAVRTAAAHDPQQLEAGMIAYGAMAALQDPAFVAGVRRITADPGAREAMVRQLVASPEAAIELPGAERAATRARSALLRQVEPLLANGARVKQAAYDVQHHGWSKVMVEDARERLALVKRMANEAFTPSPDDANHLFQAVSAPSEPRAAATPSPVVLRSVALAAIALAGQADEAGSEAVRPLLTEARSASCVRMAKLNLFQCMAVAGPHYEDIFCVSQHAMLEPGQCVASAVGAEAPMPAIQTAQARSVAFPVASPIPDGQR